MTKKEMSRMHDEMSTKGKMKKGMKKKKKSMTVPSMGYGKY